jgi:hypothetical protein
LAARLVNKLDLRTQEALHAFETEIFSARAQEPLPEGTLDFPPLLRCPSSSVPGCLRPGRSTQNRPDIKGRQSFLLSGEY